MAKHPKKYLRKQPGNDVVDGAMANSLSFNRYASAFKQIPSGPALEPLDDGAGGFTTDATTARAIAQGEILAIYNNSNTLYSVTFGTDNAVAVLASGVVDNATGRVGIPCKPNDWTYISGGVEEVVAAGQDEDKIRAWVRTQNAALLVYTIKDDTRAILQG